MKRDAMFQGEYINSDTVDERGVDLTVVTLATESIRQQSGAFEDMQVLIFEEMDEHLVLRKTTWHQAFDILGEESDDWPGKKVNVYRTQVEMGSRWVPGVRLRPPQGNTAPAPEKAKK